VRIAVNALCAAVGGGRTHLLQILPRLLALAPRHRFTVFVAAEDAAEFRVPDAANAEWVEVPVSGFDTRGRLAWENLVLPRHLSRGAFDVVLSPSNLSHFHGRVPRVIVVHNVLPFHRALHAGESWRTRIRLRLLAWGTRHFVRTAEGTIFLSVAGRDDVLRGTGLAPRLEAVVPHGVDPGFGRSDPATAADEVARRFQVRRPFVLYASHLYRYKKVESLIDAFAQGGPELRRRMLLLAGAPYDAAYAAELRRRVAGAALEDRVRFLGSVPHEGLSVLHAAADALAFLSVCENCPNLVLEALNAGGPLVLANRPVLREFAGDAALYVDPDRPGEVASALERALADPALRGDLRTRARERASRYSWDRAAADTLRLLERVGSHRARDAA
jgi:glycosyltransferase involved in cell wall biosynthesis